MLLPRSRALIGAIVVMALAGCLFFPMSASAASRFVLEKCDSVLPAGGTAGAIFTGPAPALGGIFPGRDTRGRVVILQAAMPGAHRWITFRKAATGIHGKFKARYHFTSTTRRITYRFRAVAPRRTMSEGRGPPGSTPSRRDRAPAPGRPSSCAPWPATTS